MQQKISTPFQQFWLSKWKSGSENVDVDASSRVTKAEIMLLALSVLDSNLA